MPLIDLDLPSPKELRGGWAALSAVCTAGGWTDSVYADKDQWYFHDGGGNWACLRFADKRGAILVGYDHEYTQTYFRGAAQYFAEEETDLLFGAPDWWEEHVTPSPFGDWIGFVYGRNGTQWQRAVYDIPDGFNELRLLSCCSIDSTSELSEHAAEAPGLGGKKPDPLALSALVTADADITESLLLSVAPGWDIHAGAMAGRRFLDAPC